MAASLGETLSALAASGTEINPELAARDSFAKTRRRLLGTLPETAMVYFICQSCIIFNVYAQLMYLIGIICSHKHLIFYSIVANNISFRQTDTKLADIEVRAKSVESSAKPPPQGESLTPLFAR